MKLKTLLISCLAIAAGPIHLFAEENSITISSIHELAEYAAQSGNTVRMTPGVYRMADYVTDEVLTEVRREVAGRGGRPTVRMMEFSGNDNRFDLNGVVLEIDTDLYRRLPGGYVRCVFVSGDNNTFDGLTIRNTGPNQGSGGTIMALFGEGNTLENITLNVFGSRPWGYGDLLGKGGPNLVSLQKQSGIQILGSRTTLRRCKIITRAFGHAFYIQGGDDILLEDCYAEGIMRATSDMLRDTSGPAFEKNFESVYENRDGRYMFTPGYMKSLVEDGFRTYGGAGSVTLRNCVAINMRAGFEIGARDDAQQKTVIENSVALGCERGFLLGSHVIVRQSRGDIVNGPLLYLRGGNHSDIELELAGSGSDHTVHALATIAGSNHRVRLTRWNPGEASPQVPIMVGYGMPAHAEMASPIRPAPSANIDLINETGVPIITVPDLPESVSIKSDGPIWSHERLSDRQGRW